MKQLRSSMKRIFVATTVLLAMAIGASSADRRNFWMLNNTGRTITSFRLAVHGIRQPWGDDVLGTGTLASAAGTVVYFEDYDTNCVYDFRIGYADGTHQDYVEG